MQLVNILSSTTRFSIGLMVSLALLVGGCGGGGSSSSPPPPPVIQALLFSFPAGSVPPTNFTNALASVTDSSSGANITNATVTMNGVTLTYNGTLTHQQYEGSLVINPGDIVTLVVKVGGSTYTASGTQFTSYPAISAPASGDSWAASSANTVTWSGGAPLANAVYLLGVLDAADPAGGLPYFQAVSSATTSFTIPPNSLAAGNRYLIVGITTLASVSNADASSAFIFGGFNYVPITVVSG